MKKILQICLVICCCLLLPAVGLAGKGHMGGAGKGSAGKEPVTDTSASDGGVPDTVEGPLNDKKSDSGKLFGDLYKLLRQQGGEVDKKLVPQVNADGTPKISSSPAGSYFFEGIQLFDVVTNPIGGEPVLTVFDPESAYNFKDYGWFAFESGTSEDGDPVYKVAQSPYPAQCVQPVASYERWGDISAKTGLTKNRLPMVITYDATWGRSECEVGELSGIPTVNSETGDITFYINDYFVEPCDKYSDGSPIPADKCQWKDLKNDIVTYPDGVLWADLIGEVHFGRLNISRSPDAVLQAAFDEAINNINSPNTIAIKIDPAGRLLLTKEVYDEIEVDPATGLPVKIGTIEKAIDSPLENISLYVKLMQDGHLVTPADERAPIDRSKNGGIPLWKLLELTDGPAVAELRPTIDIAAAIEKGLPGSLVDVTSVTYLTYYQCVDANDSPTPCLCRDYSPAQPEVDSALVACDNVVGRILVSTIGECPDGPNADNPIVCDGPFVGITTDGDYAPDGYDLNFAAAFLAAAADKTGDLDVDMVVYLNSILGINKVVGYSEYDADGNPTATAIDYQKSPEYFNFNQILSYGLDGREATFNNRGHDGKTTVLQGATPTWSETVVKILEAEMDNKSIFDNIGMDISGFPNGKIAAKYNILGFTQQADDDLSVINFVHTYQIPGLR